jgi:two-component system, OmpR family, response regulator
MARILIVDDDPDVVYACSMILKKEGHKTDFAINRIDGLKKAETNKFDLLILDVMMEQPDDGIHLAQDLKKKNISLPILMLTGISKVAGMEYGRDNEMVPVDEFIEKPVDTDVLVEKVNGLLK